MQDAGDSDRGRRLRARRPHQSGPGPGTATPPGRCSGQWLACRRQTRTRSGGPGRTGAASRPRPTGASLSATLRPFSRRGHPPTSEGGGRRVKVTLPPTPCTRHAATKPRVYNAFHQTGPNAERFPAVLIRLAPKFSESCRFDVRYSDPGRSRKYIFLLRLPSVRGSLEWHRIDARSKLPRFSISEVHRWKS